MASTSLSKALARYSISLNLESLPETVVEKARLCVLDTLGCMIAGATTEQLGLLRKDAIAHEGSGSATVVGSVEKLQARAAVAINGTAAHVLEFDDGHRPSDNHLGCVIVPAALAAAEEHDRSIAELIAAVVVGYDVMGRIGEAVCLPRMVSPFHGTATTGVFGAATVYARLAGMSADTAYQALNIAGTAAAGLREAMAGGQCKPLQVGHSVQSGIQAAQLASLGYTGPSTILEGPNGFLNAMSSQPRPAAVLADLGERFAVSETGFKLHSCCGVLFTAVDLAAQLRNRLPDLDSLDHAEVALPSWIANDPVFTSSRPDTIDTARFSVPFTTALALRDGNVVPSNLTDSAVDDPQLTRIAERIRVRSAAEVEEIAARTRNDPFFFYPASLTLHWDDESVTALSTSPRGYDPKSPLSTDEVVKKFHRLTEPYMSPSQIDSVAHTALSGIDTPVRQLMSECTPPIA